MFVVKKQKIDIKKIIKRKIEARHENLIFIEKGNAIKGNIKNPMNERVKQRIYGVPVKPLNTDSINNIDFVFNKTGELFNYLPISIDRKPLSIIITAYQTQEFIEECLNSVENQTYFKGNDNYEILVGIDGCQDTLNKLLEISDKYRNLSLYLMVKNKGTYVTTNTLINLAKYENILRFDSDDIMKPELVNEVMYYADEYDIVQLKYRNFKTDIKSAYGRCDYANGAIFVKKAIFEAFGGYQPWLCAADYEFLMRVNKHVKIKRLNNLVLYRRMHNESLTKKEGTKMTSNLRKKYHKSISINDYSEIIKIERKTNSFFKIK